MEKFHIHIKPLKAGIIFLMTVFFSTILISHAYLETSITKRSDMNRLKDEKSSYLLQHADNPVDWYPWSEEAFEKAKKEDKPVLLSIGYSTCHWCHVMEHESFEDGEVAKLMNDAFISIKVDREERPDIDNIYMTVCHILSQGSCGWPLNIIMTPEKKPFFAGTYIPKQSRFGRLGMIELVPKVKDMWLNQREEILNSAESITQTLKIASDATKEHTSEDLDKFTQKRCYEQLSSRFDNENGGFGRAPKFPTPHNLLMLLRYWKKTGEQKALDMVTKTLDEMSRGGIYDHIGFGFHRYSTDAKWVFPHFEKMLYDQALIAMAYVEAFQITKNSRYEKTAREILTYVLRDMTSADGGFYSAEDADSEGEEGKFYLWSEEEIRKILGDDEARLVATIFNANPDGNFRDEATGEKPGTNILHLIKSYDETAKELNIDNDELNKIIQSSREKLFNEREKRIHPSKDDKILTDWNGLMISAFSKAARAFNEPKYSETASNAVQFINKNLIKDSRLLHRFRDGDSSIQANIDDYAFFTWGLLEFYEATFETKYLKQAIELTDEMIKHFWDETSGGFYFTPDDGEKLLVRQKEVYDGALPSGNSVAFYNLLRISRFTSNPEYEEKANSAASAFSPALNKAPISHTMFMTALDFALGPSYEVVIAGEKNSIETMDTISKLRENYTPNKVVILKEDDDIEISGIAPYTKSQKPISGKVAAYVCKDFICNLPTSDSGKMLELLNKK